MRFLLKVRKILLAVVAALTFGGSVHAFDGRDVARVVTVLEQLSEDLGDFAYDEDAAAESFEDDSAGEGRIAAAGFTEASWREHLDRTMKGFFATFSEAEVKEIFKGIEDLKSRTDFTAEQISALTELLLERQAALTLWRVEGAADAATVKPYAKRIRAVLENERPQ